MLPSRLEISGLFSLSNHLLVDTEESIQGLFLPRNHPEFSNDGLSTDIYCLHKCTNFLRVKIDFIYLLSQYFTQCLAQSQYVQLILTEQVNK